VEESRLPPVADKCERKLYTETERVKKKAARLRTYERGKQTHLSDGQRTKLCKTADCGALRSFAAFAKVGSYAIHNLHKRGARPKPSQGL